MYLLQFARHTRNFHKCRSRMPSLFIHSVSHKSIWVNLQRESSGIVCKAETQLILQNNEGINEYVIACVGAGLLIRFGFLFGRRRLAASPSPGSWSESHSFQVQLPVPLSIRQRMAYQGCSQGRYRPWPNHSRKDQGSRRRRRWAGTKTTPAASFRFGGSSGKLLVFESVDGPLLYGIPWRWMDRDFDGGKVCCRAR